MYTTHTFGFCLNGLFSWSTVVTSYNNFQCCWRTISAALFAIPDRQSPASHSVPRPLLVVQLLTFLMILEPWSQYDNLQSIRSSERIYSFWSHRFVDDIYLPIYIAHIHTNGCCRGKYIPEFMCLNSVRLLLVIKL